MTPKMNSSDAGISICQRQVIKCFFKVKMYVCVGERSLYRVQFSLWLQASTRVLVHTPQGCGNIKGTHLSAADTPWSWVSVAIQGCTPSSDFPLIIALLGSSEMDRQEFVSWETELKLYNFYYVATWKNVFAYQ